MTSSNDIIPCELLPETHDRIEAFAESLRQQAYGLGKHGLTAQQFRESGLFESAIERLRGQTAASMSVKQTFMADILEFMRKRGAISGWDFAGGGERHDYVVRMPTKRVCIVETKGCLDGNNTNIFERPPNADEFVIWSLCQNSGADPRHNAWSGIHTRLGTEVIHRRQLVNGLVIWDMLCGTLGRVCPKLAQDGRRATVLASGRKVPPPCLYLFPRSIPDPRNNPSPPCWQLREVELLKALYDVFGGRASDVVEVRIATRMKDADVQRRTECVRAGTTVRESRWTTIKRARA